MSSIKIADPRHLAKYYADNRFHAELISKCNSQEFIAGKTVGEGFFLTTVNQFTPVTTRNVQIDLYNDLVQLNLYVQDIYELDHRHIVLHTRERKYVLESYVVTKNYNMDLSASLESWQNVLDDIVAGTPFTLSHTNADYPVFEPERVLVDGMPVLKALEYILNAIGHTFHDNGSNVLVITTPKTTRPAKYRVFEESILEYTPSDICIVYPYESPTSDKLQYYHSYQNRDGNSGRAETAFYPFLYYTGTNDADINTLSTWLRNKFRLLSPVSRHIVYKHETNFRNNYYTRAVLNDYGSGPMTIYETLPLPKIPVPEIPIFLNASANCNAVRFTIDTVDTSTTPYSAIVNIAARQCGCEQLPWEHSGQMIVFDGLECLLYDETPEALEERAGTAYYMAVEREDTLAKIAFNFRETSGYVTDISPEQFKNKAHWVDTTDTEDFNVTTALDRRLAGYVSPNSSDPITFEFELPEPGTYNIYLAAGANNASSTNSITIFDDTEELTTVSGFASSGSFIDATGSALAAADWPNDNSPLPLEFKTTICKIVLEGTETKLAHLAAIRLMPCSWEIWALCCP